MLLRIALSIVVFGLAGSPSLAQPGERDGPGMGPPPAQIDPEKDEFLVKIKAATALFPWWRFFIVWPGDDQHWQMKEIKP